MVIFSWGFWEINVFGEEHAKNFPKWVLNWNYYYSAGWYDNVYGGYGGCGFFILSNLLKFLLVGGAFFALSEYFQGKMHIYGMLAGIGFLTKGLWLIIGVIVFYVGHGRVIFDSKGVIASITELLCYISTALFFFGFNKTYKS